MDVDYPELEVPLPTKADIQADLERKWSSFKDGLHTSKSHMQETHVNDSTEKSYIKGGEFLVRDQTCDEIFIKEEFSED